MQNTGIIDSNNCSASERNPVRKARRWVWFVATAWLGTVGCGLWTIWAYENRPGADATAPIRWPADSPLVPSADGSTLVFVAHPHCTCTSASLDELTETLARVQRRPKTYVLFLRPAGFGVGWEQTDLWRRASALPDVTVIRDDGGLEARRFGVETSGQTLLYDRRGALVFSGGITGSRGHVGENAGMLTLVGLLTRGQSEQTGSRVFGCPLFAPTD